MANLRNKIFRIAFGDVIGRGLGVITSIYLARVLGAESYGIIVVAMSVLGYSIWGADLGLLNIGAREMAKIPEKRVFRAREIFIVKLILGTIVVTVLSLVVPLLSLDDLTKTIILGYSYSLIPYALLLEWYYNGRQHFGKVALSKIINNGFYLFAVFLFVHANSDLQIIPALYTIGVSLAALVLAGFAFYRSPFELPSRGIPVFKDLIQSAFTVGLGWFFTQMIVLLPPIAIGFLISEETAGLYGAAIRVVFIALLIDRIFVNLLIPNLSSVWEQNRDLAKEQIRIVYRIMLYIGGLLTLVIALMAPEFIRFLYTSSYEASIPILIILSLLVFATFQNSIFTLGLVALGRDTDYFNSTSLGGTIAAILIFLATISNNILYVAAIVVVSEFIITGISFIKFNRIIKMEAIRPFMIILVTGVGLFLIHRHLNYSVYLETLVSILLFTGISFLTGAIGITHFKWIREKLIS